MLRSIRLERIPVKDTFATTLPFGQIGEGYIATWLRGRGWNVLPVYEKEIDNGKGPRLFMAKSSGPTQLIAPDMLALKDGKFMWVEAKRKTRFSWYGKGGYWVTGIDKRHYDDYCAVFKTTKIQLWIMFLHSESHTWPEDVRKWHAPETCPVGLFGNTIDCLMNTASHVSHNYGTSGMIYWNISALRALAPLAAIMPQPTLKNTLQLNTTY